MSKAVSIWLAKERAWEAKAVVLTVSCLVPGYQASHGPGRLAQGIEDGEPCVHKCLLGSEEILHSIQVWGRA